MTLGLLQLGSLLLLRVRLQAAAQEAARAYAVWQPEDPSLALFKARRAAWLALRPQPRGSAIDVRTAEAKVYNANAAARHDRWLRGTLAQRLIVGLRLPAPMGLAWVWPRGLRLEAPVMILSEESVERLSPPR